ncbi:MAG: ATP-dependent zinc protease [Deltaproteobacteria bacterium]|nr:ATP-dependent zinc protease [Deltaproteobacteria bacterium]
MLAIGVTEHDTNDVHDGPILVGWREWVSLPQLGIVAIKAKADTGARTSAMHAESIERHSVHGTPMIAFRVFPFRSDRVTSIAIEAPLVGERLVRSSDGDAQMRPIVRTTLELAGVSREIEISLACRDLMGFRMLLGRVALAGMLVDPMRSYLWGEFEPPPASDVAPPAR